MTDIVLNVEGMTCMHCKASVEKAVKGLAGVQSAAVDLAKKNVTVVYDGGRLSVDAIKEAITDAGYDLV